MVSPILLTSIKDAELLKKYENALLLKPQTLIDQKSYVLKMYFIEHSEWIIKLFFDDKLIKTPESQNRIEKSAKEWLKGKKANAKLTTIFIKDANQCKIVSPQIYAKGKINSLYRYLNKLEKKEVVKERKEFPAPYWPWSLNGTYAESHKIHGCLGASNDKELYDYKMLNHFYNPFHAAVLQKIQSSELRDVLTIVYGSNETILEKISAALYQYHIVQKGNGEPARVIISKYEIYQLDMEVENFFYSIMDINNATGSLVKITPRKISLGKRFISVEMIMYIPQTFCFYGTKTAKTIRLTKGGRTQWPPFY